MYKGSKTGHLHQLDPFGDGTERLTNI